VVTARSVVLTKAQRRMLVELRLILLMAAQVVGSLRAVQSLQTGQLYLI
jgi:hypothetical protein